MATHTASWQPIATYYNPLMAGSIDGTDEFPHDHAIVRAFQAKYKPNKSVVGEASLTLFIGRLNPATTEGKVREVFSRFGKVKRCRLVRDIITGFSKCYAFLEFSEKYDYYCAHRDGNHMIIDGSEVFVDFECERTLSGWIPRRFGGGLGGKKESGQLRFGGRDRPFRKPIIVQQPSERLEDGSSFRERLGETDGNWRGRYQGDSEKRPDFRRTENRSRDRREFDRYSRYSFEKGEHRSQKYEKSRGRSRNRFSEDCSSDGDRSKTKDMIPPNVDRTIKAERDRSVEKNIATVCRDRSVEKTIARERSGSWKRSRSRSRTRDASYKRRRHSKERSGRY